MPGGSVPDSTRDGASSGCCVPPRGGPDEGTPAPEPTMPAEPLAADGMVLLAGGPFLMGTSDPGGYPADGEGPVRQIQLNSFWIDSTTVSNAEFGTFVRTTGYVTEAEKYGWSF